MDSVLVLLACLSWWSSRPVTTPRPQVQPRRPQARSDRRRTASGTLGALKKGGRRKLVADVLAGDHGGPDMLISACSDSVGQWHVDFWHSGCVIVQPTAAGYSLTDDIKLRVTKVPGKRGEITHLHFYG